ADQLQTRNLFTLVEPHMLNIFVRDTAPQLVESPSSRREEDDGGGGLGTIDLSGSLRWPWQGLHRWRKYCARMIQMTSLP
ncbi:hypothetical protein PIB30_014047, partial [Stylosanthes scabra]|nr:hypothetical protein [Stylosanthes scabra]